MDTDLGEIEKILGHQFEDRTLLQLALTHKSIKSEEDKVGHNERLEHLGDSVLNFMTSDALYHGLPKCSEGALSRIRAQLVDTHALATIAVSIGVSRYLNLAPSVNLQGRARGILADSVEALLGAVYCDGGIRAARTTFKRLFGENVAMAIAAPDQWAEPDPKTMLQERMQGAGKTRPVYRVVDTEQHERLGIRIFTTECLVEGAAYKGVGPSRQEAEQDAAIHAIYAMEGLDSTDTIAHTGVARNG